jgi:hypothetical protein
MESLSVSDKQAFDFMQARERAIAEARERITEPVILAWKDVNSGAFAPAIPGGNDGRRHDYGESFGGQLELATNKNCHFILTDSSHFDKPDIHFKSIPARDGDYFLCLNEACTDEDRKQSGAPYGDGLGDGQATGVNRSIQSRSRNNMHYCKHVNSNIHTSIQTQP